MKNMIHSIRYEEYDSLQELTQQDRILMQEAIAATQGAYAPYSKFCVGAAVRLQSGQLVRGANQENAAYPSGLCAERTALFSAHALYPNDPVEAIAIVASINGQLTPNFTYPCGACRQVMAESEMRAQAPISVFVGSATRILRFEAVASLLPFIFDNLPEKD